MLAESTTGVFFYLSSFVILVAWLLATGKDLIGASLADKLLLLGPLFFAMPLAVFGTQHFVQTAGIMGIMPQWIPAHRFFVLLVGICLLAAALSIATRIQSALAAFLFAVMMLCFEALMIIPGAVADPHDRFGWTIMAREFTFACGALAIAAGHARSWSPATKRAVALLTRFGLGVAISFFGIEQLLHPAFVPGVPLRLMTPTWIPGHVIWTYVSGVVFVVAGLCLITNQRSRSAAMSIGLMLLVVILAVYLPMLIAKPFDINGGIDYLFDTLLLCGSVLAVARIQEQSAARRVEMLTAPR